MITVEQADELILSTSLELGIESIPFMESKGRVLAEQIIADRAFPPFDRVTMDGIAISYETFEKGLKKFKIEYRSQAGSPLYNLQDSQNCVEVMTGAIRPEGTDTIIRYEDLIITEASEESFAEIVIPTLNQGQNIHRLASDREDGVVLLKPGRVIGSPEIAILATVGKSFVKVSKVPRVAIISTGDELVETDQIPELHQIRISNSYMLEASLSELAVKVSRFHLKDDLEELRRKLRQIISEHDVLVLSGGVSMGKADFIPQVLEYLEVEKSFHKVKQRPGKPLWFGKSKEIVVFALPGNPVSSFASTHRYIIPWIKQQLNAEDHSPIYAKLTDDIYFKPALTYFMQVQGSCDKNGEWIAEPIEGHGSGDHANLLRCNGFLQVNARERSEFKAGEIFRFIPFRNL